MFLNIDKLKSFLDQLRNISLWDRIFRWAKFRNQLIDAGADIQQLNAFSEFSRNMQATSAGLSKDLEIAINQVNDLKSESKVNAEKIRRLNEEIMSLSKENAELKNIEENRRAEHSNDMATLKKIQDQILQEREKEINAKNELQLERIRKLKDTWSLHQQNVKNALRSICSKYNIEYIDKVPFRGEPDNTLRICNEYVIFDAKSPGGDDLRNFPLYVREQAEKAKKYIKEEGVRKEIFLIVPSNALEVISTHVYRLADYTVYIISQDSLEPLILSLQRLEDYEFAGQLSPDERDNICRVIGKFAHLTKRRIQIDTFFIRQFMELAYASENDLPADILEKTIEYEKAEKLNPPTERRSKQINMKELEKETAKLGNETSAKGIPLIEDVIAGEINKMPLYNT